MRQERIEADPTVKEALLKVELEDGYAECMGEGLFIVFQEHEGETHSLVLSREDLAKLLDQPL